MCVPDARVHDQVDVGVVAQQDPRQAQDEETKIPGNVEQRQEELPAAGVGGVVVAGAQEAVGVRGGEEDLAPAAEKKQEPVEPREGA